MTRPDPDQLLAAITDQAAQATRAPLKIWFGASPGVGKTYAMLTAARQALAAGLDVLIGVLETHGRKDTAALLADLPRLPLRKVDLGQDRSGEEFDLDGALARRPQVLLVDELAHTNLPGSRHPKRWQDIAELRAAGIEVWSTVNVQHLESLNDVVGGITGVRVRETIPDRVLDEASEIVLVDVPADDLLARLKAGKVYLPDVATRAQQNFFRKGNLIALRELALRRTADRVDADVRGWRRAQAVEPVWHHRDSLLACVDTSAHAATVVRRAARLAAKLEVPWHALHVETPAVAARPDAERARALEALELAQQLGAVSATRGATDAVAATCEYARQHNLGSLLIGPSRQRHRRWFQSSFANRMSALADDLVVIQVGAETAAPIAGRSSAGSAGGPGPRAPWTHYAMAGAIVAAVSLVCLPLAGRIDLANIVMLFLLAVIGTAFWLGRGPAVVSTILGVLAFDVLYVPPRFSLAVSDWQYLITFAVMLFAGLLTGQLTARLRFQNRVTQSRERRAMVLFETARELSSAMSAEQIAVAGAQAMQQAFAARSQLWILDFDEQLYPHPPEPWSDAAVARWALEKQQPAGAGTQSLPAQPALYLPLLAPMRCRGVLAVQLERPQLLKIPEQQRLLDTFARLIALALERVHYTTVAREALVRMESERLRNTLLHAVSHDLRTPLTALRGSAERLAASQPQLSAEQHTLALALAGEAQRLTRLVENLLQMARLESGEIQLKRSWWPLEEVVGAALRARQDALSGHRVQLDMPAGEALVEADPVLIEQVLCNLLENAAKYSPPGTTILLRARVGDAALRLDIADQGPGLPAGGAERLFAKFVRGSSESPVPGIGLGLAIVRSIVAAHGGTISAGHGDPGGAVFTVVLPQPEPPPAAPVAPP